MRDVEKADLGRGRYGFNVKKAVLRELSLTGLGAMPGTGLSRVKADEPAADDPAPAIPFHSLACRERSSPQEAVTMKKLLERLKALREAIEKGLEAHKSDTGFDWAKVATIAAFTVPETDGASATSRRRKTPPWTSPRWRPTRTA